MNTNAQCQVQQSNPSTVFMLFYGWHGRKTGNDVTQINGLLKKSVGKAAS